MAGGGDTSSSVSATCSTPPTAMLPASVTALVSWVVTGGVVLARRWRPLMPVSPPVVPVVAPTRPPTVG